MEFHVYRCKTDRDFFVVTDEAAAAAMDDALAK